MSEFLIITGMSGAGRSTAARSMEDLGWFRVDNMPPAMFGDVAKMVAVPGSGVDRVAFVVGTGAFISELAPGLDGLRGEGHRVRILFLEASDEVLVRRFEGTRHRHPMAGALIEGSIQRERELLEPIREQADLVLDTSDLNENALRQRMAQLFAATTDAAAMQTALISFGYKHGLPLDADLVLDCRFLPNPHWVDELRPFTGREAPVRDYVLSQPDAEPFIAGFTTLLENLIPGYMREGRRYLTLAVGCTGGKHRSVAVAEELGARLASPGVEVRVTHRDLGRE